MGAMLYVLCASAAGRAENTTTREQADPWSFFRLLRVDAFRQSLRELGWVDRQNIAIESRLAEVSLERLSQLANELTRLKVTAIVADGEPAIVAAKRATTTIPIVFVSVGDPVSEGFVASLARPGGNLTGLTSISAELSGKRLELLKDGSRKSLVWLSSGIPTMLRIYSNGKRWTSLLGSLV